MPEIKRTFSGSKMNKDVDERIVPPTEYRDALNVEINTSESSNVGTVQTTLGNTVLTSIFPTGSTCVGSIASTKNDKIYWLIAGASKSTIGSEAGGGDDYTLVIKKDYIVEWDVHTATFRYILVDIYEVKTTHTNAGHSPYDHLHIVDGGNNSVNITGVRIGMNISGTFINNSGASILSPSGENVDNGDTYTVFRSDNITVVDIQKDTGTLSDWRIYPSVPLVSALNDSITFTSERLLNFDSNRLITGINVLDGMLFWTDDHSEPKKINIERCALGTGGLEYLKGGGIAGFDDADETQTSNVFNQITDGVGDVDRTDHFHTRLVSSTDGFTLEVMTNPKKQKAIWLEEEHITVIKKAPLTPPYLKMSSTEVERIDPNTGVANSIFTSLSAYSFANPSDPTSIITSGPNVISNLNFESSVDFRVGDTIILTSDPDANGSSFVDHEVRIRIEAPLPSGAPPAQSGYSFSVLSIDDNIGTSAVDWSVRLEQSKPLFESKFPRFAYRYKYKDGEYSPFSPFSEVAFLAGDFNYVCKQGYNLGMSNQLRTLKITDYVVEPAAKGEDVIEIDILFKNENSPNIYTVKTIKPSDDHPVWPDLYNNSSARGEYEIESELIHAVVATNQLIRPWDNVPIQAKAQDVTGNRLIYGNYVQNYDMIPNIGGVEITPGIQVGLESTLGDLVSGVTDAVPSPSKSVKSLRTYQVGVVYRDKYGRETPVQAGDAVNSVIEIDKKECVAFNKIKAQITSPPPFWADSWKFFIKETSNEYYNLAMDRWYNAEDGNVWISFPSAERNKVQEDTFLILKKQHDNDTPVTDEARYKVVAVSNEAPDFIKLNQKPVGKLLSLENKVDPNNFPYVNFQHLSVNASAINSAILAMTVNGTDTVKDPDLRGVMHSGYLFMRIGDLYSKSNWYKIANIVDQGSDTKITIDGIFGEDMRFASPLQTTASISDGLFLEVVTKIPENKAEFDGRFFVKVLRDLVLVENILSKIGDVDYQVINSMNTFYVKYLNAEDSGSDSIFASKNSGSNSTYNLFPKNHSSNSSVNAHFNNLPGIILSANINRKEGIQAWWRAWNNIGDPAKSDKNKYSSGDGGWFIDSAITANEVTIADSSFLKVVLGGDVDAGASGSNHNSDIAHETHGVFDAGNPNYANVHNTGISGTGTAISLSWSGIGSEYEVYNGNKPANENFGVGSGIEPEQAPYVKLLKAKGTKFRFSQDPDGIIYTIKHTKQLTKRYNFDTDNSTTLGIEYHDAFDRIENKRYTLKLVVQTENGNGIGVEGVGYNPTIPYNAAVNGGDAWDDCDSNSSVRIEFVEPYDDEDNKFTSDNPAIWETEPKENIELDIYYEASPAYPTTINAKTNEQFAKIGSIVQNESLISTSTPWSGTTKVLSWSETTVTLDTAQICFVDNVISFTAPDGGATRLVVKTANATAAANIEFKDTPHEQVVTLPYSNCFAFGNGVESNRIKDDYNEIFIKNGVKASAVLAKHYEQERRSAGMIHSGIYNSTSGKNDLNQFIQGEAITKDLNPRHGSIQKLLNRNTDLVAITEDKCFQILSNKDALFNADGSTQLMASNKVLGTAKAYTGDFGTTNPESVAQDNFRAYFVDRTRGKVCRLSMDGVTPISSAGMHDWFADNLQVSTGNLDNGTVGNKYKISVASVIGSFDSKKQLYNATIRQKAETIKGFSYESPIDTYYTVSYSEMAKGWVSFKSFFPESGVSLNNEYYTWKDAELYKHHDNDIRNNFYGVQYDSSIKTILNDQPGSIKSFNTLNYEGSQAKVNQHKLTTNTTDANGANVSQQDGQYYNLNAKTGWYVDSFTTNEQTAIIPEFIEKEGKWFNYIRGEATTLANLDQTEFSVQGIGSAASSSSSGTVLEKSNFIITNNTSTSYVGADGSGSAWDSTAD